ncbi:MAG: phosphate ABC transporter, permease protein PstA, partial [Oscillospiraceae bacterium]|nr:phosphate ABC transporter, permease protein PstA [Oscillospiraceae bacterium]
ANSLIRAYTSSGATLSVALYMAVSEEGDFATGYAIAAVLMVLVLVLNLLARLAQTKLKRKI